MLVPKREHRWQWDMCTWWSMEHPEIQVSIKLRDIHQSLLVSTHTKQDQVLNTRVERVKINVTHKSDYEVLIGFFDEVWHFSRSRMKSSILGLSPNSSFSRLSRPYWIRGCSYLWIVYAQQWHNIKGSFTCYQSPYRP